MLVQIRLRYPWEGFPNCSEGDAHVEGQLGKFKRRQGFDTRQLKDQHTGSCLKKIGEAKATTPRNQIFCEQRNSQTFLLSNPAFFYFQNQIFIARTPRPRDLSLAMNRADRKSVV